MKLLLFVICVSSSWPCAAFADTLTISDTSDQVLLQLSLPTSLVVTDFTEGGYFAALSNSDVYGATDIGFGSSDYFAQFFVAGAFGFDYFNSSQLYSGGEAAPTLLPGSYALTSAEGMSYTLLISDDVAATPEPNSMLLCGTGCLLLCGVLPRRFEQSKRVRSFA